MRYPMADFDFEKFVKDIENRKNKRQDEIKEYVENHGDSPQRKYNKLYRERWQNRIKWIKK